MTIRIYPVIFCFVSLTTIGCAQRAPQTEPAPPTPQMETLVVRSTPLGANVRLSSGESCRTPCSMPKMPDQTFSVTVELEHYLPSTVRVSNNLEALREYNRKRGASEESLRRLTVRQIKLVPNPVNVVLEPKWSK